MKRLWTIMFAIVLAVYPALIYFGLTRFETRIVAISVLVFVLVRMLILSEFKVEKLRPLLPLFFAGSSLSIIAAVFNSEKALLLMPVMTSIIFLVTFGITLVKGPSMVERFAALKEKNMTPQIVSYCYKVTIVWCTFFVLNGSAAFYTVFYMSKEYWTLYNGLISYLIIGLLFAGEFMVRKIVIKNETA